MKSGALGDWHLYFVISTEALMYELRSGEIIDTELYKRMRVIKKELYTAIAKTILTLVTYKLPLHAWKKSDRLLLIKIEDFLKKQPVKVQNKIFKIIEAIETLERVPANYLKSIRGTKGLYESRIKLGTDI